MSRQLLAWILCSFYMFVYLLKLLLLETDCSLFNSLMCSRLDSDNSYFRCISIYFSFKSAFIFENCLNSNAKSSFSWLICWTWFLRIFMHFSASCLHLVDILSLTTDSIWSLPNFECFKFKVSYSNLIWLIISSLFLSFSSC